LSLNGKKGCNVVNSLEDVREHLRVPDPDKAKTLEGLSGERLTQYLDERRAMMNFEDLHGVRAEPFTVNGQGDFKAVFQGSERAFDVKNFPTEAAVKQKIMTRSREPFSNWSEAGKGARKNLEAEKFSTENVLRAITKQKSYGRITVLQVGHISESEVNSVLQQVSSNNLSSWLILVD
jgi:hypothetical protein